MDYSKPVKTVGFILGFGLIISGFNFIASPPSGFVQSTVPFIGGGLLILGSVVTFISLYLLFTPPIAAPLALAPSKQPAQAPSKQPEAIPAGEDGVFAFYRQMKRIGYIFMFFGVVGAIVLGLEGWGFSLFTNPYFWFMETLIILATMSSALFGAIGKVAFREETKMMQPTAATPAPTPAPTVAARIPTVAPAATTPTSTAPATGAAAVTSAPAAPGPAPTAVAPGKESIKPAPQAIPSSITLNLDAFTKSAENQYQLDLGGNVYDMVKVEPNVVTIWRESKGSLRPDYQAGPYLLSWDTIRDHAGRSEEFKTGILTVPVEVLRRLLQQVQTPEATRSS